MKARTETYVARPVIYLRLDGEVPAPRTWKDRLLNRPARLIPVTLRKRLDVDAQALQVGPGFSELAISAPAITLPLEIRGDDSPISRSNPAWSGDFKVGIAAPQEPATELRHPAECESP